MKTNSLFSVLFIAIAILSAVTSFTSCGSDDDSKTNPENNNNNNTSENKISLEGDWIGNPIPGSGVASDSCDMTCVFRNNTISILRVSKEGAELERVSGTYTLTDNIITATWTIGRYDTEQLRMSDFKGYEMRLTKRNIIYKLRLINNHGGGNNGGGNNYGSDDDDTAEEHWVECWKCKGKKVCGDCNSIYGYCKFCDGTGKIYNGEWHSVIPNVCSSCHGSGKCIYCRGTGTCQKCDGRGGWYEYY